MNILNYIGSKYRKVIILRFIERSEFNDKAKKANRTIRI